MYVLFSNDKRKLGKERRVRSDIIHWHIILFHRNICLSFKWWSRDKSIPKDIIDMFNKLDKLVKWIN